MKFRTRRKPETKSPQLTVAPSIAGKPYRAWGTSSPQTIVNDGLNRSVPLYVATTRIATAIAQARIEARNPDGEVVEHRPVALLNDGPNPSESRMTFMWRLVMQALLFSEGAFVEISGSPANPQAFWLLDPRCTKPIPGRDELVSGYEVRVAGTAQTIRLEASQVIHIKMPHPLDPFSSLPPLAAAGLAIDTDHHAAKYNARFLDRDGAPAMLLTTPDELGEAAQEEIIAALAGDQISGGYERAGAVDILAGIRELGIHQLSSSPKDAQYVAAREMAQAETMLAFGTPRSVAGDASDRTFANADAEEAVWYRWVVQPMAQLVADAFEQQTVSNPNLHLAFNFSGSALARRDEMVAREQFREDLKVGAILIDEYRAGIGLDPLPDGEGQVTITDKPAVMSSLTEAVQTKELAAKELVTFGPWSLEVDELARRRSKAEKLQGQAERLIARRIGGYITRQRKVVVAKLEGSKSFRSEFSEALTRGTLLAKAYDVSRIFDQGTWDRMLEEDLIEIMSIVVGEAGDAASSAIGVAFNVEDPTVQAGIKARTQTIVDPIAGTGFNQQTEDALRATLAEGAAAGEDLAQLVARVEEVYGDAETYRLERIARTEALGGTNLGRFEAAKQAGLGGTKTWLSVGDHRTREAHIEADGQTVGLEDAFTVGGEHLLYPGDGSAENSVNCRCEALMEGPNGELI